MAREHALVGVMLLEHTEHDPVVPDDAYVSHEQPVHLSVHFRTHYHCGRWVQCQCVSDVLFNFFRYLLLYGVIIN